MQLKVGPSLIDEVDSLIGEEAIGYVFGTGFYGKADGFWPIDDMVKGFVFPLEPFQYLDGLRSRWFQYVNLLKAPNNAARS